MSEGVEQHRGQRIHRAEGRTRGSDAGLKSVSDQSIEDGTTAGDDVHRDIPRRPFAAHGRRRLVIADQNHHEIAIPPQLQVARHRLVHIGHGIGIAVPEIHPVGLLYLGYDGAVRPYPYLQAWKHLKDVQFARVAGWATPVAATSSAPKPGAILLSSSDISTADGLDPGSLQRALKQAPSSDG